MEELIENLKSTNEILDFLLSKTIDFQDTLNDQTELINKHTEIMNEQSILISNQSNLINKLCTVIENLLINNIEVLTES